MDAKTQAKIFVIRETFERRLRTNMRLQRVTVPLVVEEGSGLNDGLEWDNSKLPVTFTSNGMNIQVVQAATKWKRKALAELEIPEGVGIITDMRAIRKDETIDRLHSITVDQWDWERVISKEKRTLQFLKNAVNTIWDALHFAEDELNENFHTKGKVLPKTLTFISAEDLFKQYPGLSKEDREREFVKKHGAAFIYAIGHILPDGKPHELRAADYDDWTLNGDIVVWNSVINEVHELSSMGIRVDAEALKSQIAITQQNDLLTLPFHKGILEGTLPLTIGGGIGQSRVCMLLLKKEHIKEVQFSVWPEEK